MSYNLQTAVRLFEKQSGLSIGSVGDVNELNQRALAAYLNALDLHAVQDRIRSFRSNGFANLSDKEFAAEFTNMFSVKNVLGGKPWQMWPIQTSTYPEGTRFFRVRRISGSKVSFPIKEMWIESDAWNPPPQVCKAGRLNREHESVLYAAPVSPRLAIDEMRISAKEFFSLIIYRASEPINVMTVGYSDSLNPEFTTDESRFKLKFINDFLHTEFTRDVGTGTEYLYRISHAIAEFRFNLPPGCIDAVYYPSVTNRTAFNICFQNPDVAKQKLELVSVPILLCKDVGKFIFVTNARGYDSTGTFLYERPEMTDFTEIVPEMVTLNSVSNTT
jgi:hypothetical protein